MTKALYYPAGAVLVWLFLKTVRIGRREPDLPPGPPTVPLLGNLNIFPRGGRLTEWARIYGGIYSLKMGPGTAIVITDPAIVKDLMDNRSQSTAGRPQSHVATRITGDMHMAVVGYTEDWRALRRAAREVLTPNACARHLSIQRAESSQLLHDCLIDPTQFFTHIRRNSFSVILSVLFGKRAPRLDTKELSEFYEVQHLWEDILSPGATPPVDFLPFLKYIPKPFAQWKSQCEKVRRLQRNVYFGLLHETEERTTRGLENGSFIEHVLARQAEFELSREHIGYLGGVMIEGGSDSTSAMLQSLILALIAFPEAQRKAQAEIDKVVGNDRMPTPEDFAQLPYIQAVIQELHRWRPIGPLSFPHATTEDVTYGGYRIPQGSTIFVNIWGMHRDPDVYDRPEDFWPDRWMLNEFGTKPGIDTTGWRNTIWFGTGRRICPGMHLANNSLMVNVMNLIWAFNFKPAVDEKTGKEIPVDVSNYTKGIIIITPEPFKCAITSRSAHHAEIIKDEFASAAATFAPYEHGLKEEDQAFIGSQRIQAAGRR